ncbi:hypothetical protein Y1Q_0019782 [Alligator mississippiensis]|uniref:Uncharacterized protein n=1 Tax=Alligator mississippiensis TaxID=8496 RepID=A0A151PF10_ALLMI|nr:hypothetical protein Y1Q_0019782 [Alligator mississippiensis]
MQPSGNVLLVSPKLAPVPPRLSVPKVYRELWPSSSLAPEQLAHDSNLDHCFLALPAANSLARTVQMSSPGLHIPAKSLTQEGLKPCSSLPSEPYLTLLEFAKYDQEQC